MEEKKIRTIPNGTKLSVGDHETFADGHCAMELVAWLAREPHSDHPSCTSPVIGEFVRSWNDSLGDEDRNRLILPIVPRLVGTTASRKVEEARAWMAADWLVRVFAPAFLELVPALREHALELLALSELSSTEIAQDHTVRDAAWAAGAASQSIAWSTAWNYAWNFGRSAARATGAARGGAWEISWTAVRASAWASARATGSDLIPAIEKLQKSAVELLIRMIEKGSHEQAK